MVRLAFAPVASRAQRDETHPANTTHPVLEQRISDASGARDRARWHTAAVALATVSRNVLAYGLPEPTLNALHRAAPDGFERTSDRRWVSEPRNEIRRILEFQAIKGAQYSARWGFGVDFVPKVRGGRPSWKRTSKTADFDVTIDPIDDAGSVQRWCSIVATDSVRHVDAVARDVWAKASEDFARVVAVADLLDLMNARATMTFRRFGPHNYVQTDLTRGLIQIAVGDLDEGMTLVGTFCERFDVLQDDAVLAKAVAHARALSAEAAR